MRQQGIDRLLAEQALQPRAWQQAQRRVDLDEHRESGQPAGHGEVHQAAVDSEKGIAVADQFRGTAQVVPPDLDAAMRVQQRLREGGQIVVRIVVADQHEFRCGAIGGPTAKQLLQHIGPAAVPAPRVARAERHGDARARAGGFTSLPQREQRLSGRGG